ncbi:MAG: hypothetical protein JWO19_5240 [Bryobacterales bacterium]|nr:hypothetical protein [Bryobacterales bacterium]
MSARTCEVYEISCSCGAPPIELPAAIVDATGTVTCAACKKVARVEWREARTA